MSSTIINRVRRQNEMRKIHAMYEHRSILLIYESFLRINEEKQKIPEEK